MKLAISSSFKGLEMSMSFKNVEIKFILTYVKLIINCLVKPKSTHTTIPKNIFLGFFKGFPHFPRQITITFD